MIMCRPRRLSVCCGRAVEAAASRTVYGRQQRAGGRSACAGRRRVASCRGAGTSCAHLTNPDRIDPRLHIHCTKRLRRLGTPLWPAYTTVVRPKALYSSSRRHRRQIGAPSRTIRRLEAFNSVGPGLFMNRQTPRTPEKNTWLPRPGLDKLTTKAARAASRRMSE